MLNYEFTKAETDFFERTKKRDLMSRLFLNPKIIFVDSNLLVSEKKRLSGKIANVIQISPSSFALLLN